MLPAFNPALDLELNRLLKAPVAKVWRCWTEPALIEQWFAPKPVVTKDVVIDLRPGGRFFTRMVMPDGAEHPGDGCILAVDPQRLLVFTDMLEEGYRPAQAGSFGFTAWLSFAPEGDHTRYIARALHGKGETRKQHEEMGFQDGWGTAATQLEELARSL
jgi:uncharacterized protein YndB with AHSA1/START domain